MPYASVSELPPAVRSKLKGKKLRQWMHVWNSAYDRHGDESRAFAEAWATVKKAIIVGSELFNKSDKVSKEGAKYVAQSKKQDRCGLCSMFMPPRGCSLVEGTILLSGWCMYFDKKTDAKLGKAKVMSDFHVFLPIEKINKEKRTVTGYASTPRKDSDGEIVTLDAVRNALPDYMAWGNIREMHKMDAVGVAQEANIDTKGLFLTAKIVDESAWQKCLEGVYKGFSIGGRKLAKEGDSITAIDLTEISVVDRPANPDARFTLAKSQKTLADEAGYLVKAKPAVTAEGKALAKMAKIVEGLAKAGPPAAHDGFSLPAKKAEQPDGVPSVNDARPNENVTRKTGTKCEKHGNIDCEECRDECLDKDAEVEKRDFDAKERREAAGSGAALPDGSFPIKNGGDLTNAIRLAGHAKNPVKAKAHIKSRAKSLGLEGKLPDSWNGSKKANKAEILKALGLRGDSFLSLKKRKEAEPAEDPLEKGMNTVGSLSYCFDSIRNAQRSLILEGSREGGDKKDKALAKELGSIAQSLAKVISQKADHEGTEAQDLSDVDDQYLTTLLGDDFDMEKTETAVTFEKTGDPIADTLRDMLQKASQPTKAMRMAMADDNMKKSRKACKMAKQAIEECHKLHKAAYIAKMEKAKKPKDDADGDEFDHAGAMEKLQKAYQELDKARTFGKAAQAQLAKASSRAGQRGQEAGDGNEFYKVPPGVEDKSVSEIAGAAPGTSGGGSQPPLYPVDGNVYPGKAVAGSALQKYSRNGQIPAEVAELLMEKTKAEGELEALRRMPAAASGGRRPYAFDMTKVSGNANGGEALNKALFEGVDPMALGSNDEIAHSAASAKVIGNFLTSGHFGKSVFDPSFKGAAGGGR